MIVRRSSTSGTNMTSCETVTIATLAQIGPSTSPEVVKWPARFSP